MRGFKDFVVNNSILSGGMSVPMISNSVSNGAVIIRHREYLRDIDASTAFNSTVFNINPGIAATFPWLAQVANSFEQYRFRGIVFEFKTTSADVVLSTATSTSLGSVVMGTQYNVLEEPFTNKFEMENWEFTTSCKPSVSCLHPIDCGKGTTPVSMLYVRSTNANQTSTAGDLRLYDLAKFNIACVGMQNATNGSAGSIGELWVNYEVELYKPKLVEDIDTSFAHFDGNAKSASGTYTLLSPGSAFPFGRKGATHPVETEFFPSGNNNSNLSCSIIPDIALQGAATTTKGCLIINDCIAKRLLINIIWIWSAGGQTPSTGYVFPIIKTDACSGLKFVKVWDSDTVYEIEAHWLDTAAVTTFESRAIYTALVECTSDRAIFALNNFTWTNSGQVCRNMDLFITEVGPNAN